MGALLCGASPNSGYSPAKVAQPGVISGSVRYGGKAPPPAKLKLSGDCAYCKKFDIRSEELLQGKNGGLGNVVVFLSEIKKGKPIPETVPTMAENRCTFEPHVLSITVGQKIRLANLDPVLNTFHAIDISTSRTLFNIGMPLKGQQVLRRIRQEGVLKMLCDVHPWEMGYVLAFSHPYHAVTDRTGAFVIEGVPPGSYGIELWHESLGLAKKNITVGLGGLAKLEHTYKPR
jgi:hypothetical protein